MNPQLVLYREPTMLDPVIGITCVFQADNYWIAEVTNQWGTRHEFGQQIQSQQRALEVLAEAMESQERNMTVPEKDKPRRTLMPTFLKGPRRVEMILLEKITAKEVRVVAIQIFGPDNSGTPTIAGRAWVDGTLSLTNSFFSIKDYYVLSVHKIEGSQPAAQETHFFDASESDSIKAFRISTKILSNFHSDAIRFLRGWAGAELSYSALAAAAHTGASSSSYTPPRPKTHLRRAGDAVGVKDIEVRVENIDMGFALVSLPGADNQPVTGAATTGINPFATEHGRYDMCGGYEGED